MRMPIAPPMPKPTIRVVLSSGVIEPVVVSVLVIALDVSVVVVGAMVEVSVLVVVVDVEVVGVGNETDVGTSILNDSSINTSTA